MTKRILLIIFISLFMIGCATVSQNPSLKTPSNIMTAEQSLPDQETVSKEDEMDKPAELKNIKEEDLEGYVTPKGIVFAKTIFEGVLNTAYVQLTIEKNNASQDVSNYELHIGNKSIDPSLPWEGKPAIAEYFYIELPEGQYRISKIAIPVSSTQAVEDVDISFEVKEDKIVYLGTLKVVGTKERIKLGGVPVIKPGFEYQVEIFNEYEEAKEQFQKKFPSVVSEIEVQLMTVNVRNDG